MGLEELERLLTVLVTQPRLVAELHADPPRFVPDISVARSADTESRWHQLATALELTEDSHGLVAALDKLERHHTGAAVIPAAAYEDGPMRLLRSHPATAWFAVLEVGVPAALLGALAGLTVGSATWLCRRA